MKFEYTGEDGCKDLDLVIYKILDKNDVLVKGTVIEVPDEQIDLIRRIKVNGNYKPVIQKKFGKKKGKRR